VSSTKATVAGLARKHDIADRRSSPITPDVDLPVGAQVPAPGQLPLIPPGAA
jgi:hypothetical protein